MVRPIFKGKEIRNDLDIVVGVILIAGFIVLFGILFVRFM